MNPIRFYEGPHYMYSNFSAFAVEWNMILAMTAEHHYQAAKFFGVSDELVQEIYAARSAHNAKQVAKRNKERIRTDWDRVKLSIMEDIVRAKLEQHPHIQQKLLETGDDEIIEDSPTDSFWGRGSDGKGENHLGKIWMKLRREWQVKK